MNRLPPVNNVYGFLFSSTSLERVAHVLQSRIGLTTNEVYVCKSQFDGSETLYVRTEEYELETQKVKEDNTWLLNGAVAGDDRTVLTLVKQLSDYLRWAGSETKFEIYDDKFNYIAEYPGNAV